MSQENVQLVRRAHEALAAGDRATALASLDEAVEWYPSMGPVLGHEVYRGREAVERLAFEEMPSVLEGYTAEVVEIHDLGDDRVLVVARFSGRATSTGFDVEQVFGMVYRLRADKIVEMRGYLSKGEALEAVGPPRPEKRASK